jgi:hypothetical protein
MSRESFRFVMSILLGVATGTTRPGPESSGVT